MGEPAAALECVHNSALLERCGGPLVALDSVRGDAGDRVHHFDDASLAWEPQGADEQGLNWGFITDNRDYMYSDLRSVFCLQTTDLQEATTLAFREGGLWADCLEEQHGWRAVTERSYG